MPSKSALSAIFTSRKGIAAFAAVLFGLIAAIGLTVATVMGKLTWDAYFTRLEVVSGTVTAALAVFIIGTAHEDAAAKSVGASSSATSGNPGSPTP